MLFLTHYDRIGAPSRYRYYQYFEAFARAGIDPKVNFIQSDAMYRLKERRQESFTSPSVCSSPT